nr:hypothetical protein GCM10020093_070860 [Planobispora longispora]
MTSYRPLHDGWTLTAVAQDAGVAGVAATVPGCVHTDLLAAGIIEDPYLDDNESRLAWIGRTGWAYETTFAWTADGHERTDLVCEGLDTVATVILNGVRIADTANQHRSYRFPVRHLLREGDNTLTVLFDSPYAYAEARQAALGSGRGPTTSRTRSSARWPATSAGTGARRWSPPESGGRSGWRAGAAPGWPRCGRW